MRSQPSPRGATGPERPPRPLDGVHDGRCGVSPSSRRATRPTTPPYALRSAAQALPSRAEGLRSPDRARPRRPAGGSRGSAARLRSGGGRSGEGRSSSTPGRDSPSTRLDTPRPAGGCLEEPRLAEACLDEHLLDGLSGQRTVLDRLSPRCANLLAPRSTYMGAVDALFRSSCVHWCPLLGCIFDIYWILSLSP